ncbi:MAG: hypothetical protein JXP34_26390 [Planctomycetes bacterium]|nr:hypothetical protein [Planctomycetota bacterium]
MPHGSCEGCCHGIGRRRFLRECGAAAVAAAGTLAARPARGGGTDRAGVKIAVVSLMSMDTHEIWPYPGFDTEARQREVLSRLREGCPGIAFVPVAVTSPADVGKALALKDEVDGYLIHSMTLVWSQTQALGEIAAAGKPMVVADEFLGGSGVFLTGLAALRDRGIPVAGVSSSRLEDLVVVARQFSTVRAPGTTPAEFARRCEKAYRETFPTPSNGTCADDPVALTDIARCVERFRRARFLIVGSGRAGEEHDFLGAKGRFIDFGELGSLYDEVDQDEAAEWALKWSKGAAELPPGEYIEPSRPSPDAIRKAGGVYLATRMLLEKYGTDSVTMNCLGGFSAGKLPAYPCLGFMQILDDGGLGVCEAMPDDTVSMLMARILTGRPGLVSDPAIDTSANRIVYSHCVGTTRVFGSARDPNAYRIRTLHNRDPRGACAESLMPAGYMTTTFRTNVGRKEMVIHQARSLGPLETERGCRTKLLAEVRGDIGKLFDHWSRFGWHRVTVYGDVKEPLAAFGKALGLKVIEEA